MSPGPERTRGHGVGILGHMVTCAVAGEGVEAGRAVSRLLWAIDTSLGESRTYPEARFPAGAVGTVGADDVISW
jgi:hypothetical protein